MGIDIQQYRASIGSFLPSRNNSYKYSIHKSKQPTETKNTNLLYYLMLLVAFCFIFISYIYYQIMHSSKTSSTSEIYSNIQEIVNCKTSSTFLPDTKPPLDDFISTLFYMVTNFQSMCTYGNKKNKGIKISHWNKGGSFLINKMPEIRNIISQHHPHILGLSEANLLDVHDQSLADIPDYNLYLCPTIKNPSLKASRVVVYTHKDLVVKMRPDLMSNTYSSIWLEVGLPHHKKFLVCQTYREWQYVNQRGDKTSSTLTQQLTRWMLFLDQWERALATGMEVHCLGDMNLNHCNWTDPNLPTTNQSYKLRELISALFTRILPHGVTQLVSGPTRHFPGQVSTGLDHYYCNRPNKISAVQSNHCGGSDHMLIQAVRHSRAIKAKPRYIRKRSYRDFDPHLFVAAVQQLSWLDVYLAEDVDEAVGLLSSKLTDILDDMAPMRTIQVRTNYVPYLSKETLSMMKERDEWQKLASETSSRVDWLRYKKLRNKVNNRLKFEESTWQKARLDNCSTNSAKTWKSVKCILNWHSSGSPNQLFSRDSLKTKSQYIADSQKEYFIEKV